MPAEEASLTVSMYCDINTVRALKKSITPLLLDSP